MFTIYICRFASRLQSVSILRSYELLLEFSLRFSYTTGLKLHFGIAYEHNRPLSNMPATFLTVWSLIYLVDMHLYHRKGGCCDIMRYQAISAAGLMSPKGLSTRSECIKSRTGSFGRGAHCALVSPPVEKPQTHSTDGNEEEHSSIHAMARRVAPFRFIGFVDPHARDLSQSGTDTDVEGDGQSDRSGAPDVGGEPT